MERIVLFERIAFSCLLLRSSLCFSEDSSLRDLFSRRLIDDRTETSHSYIEFLNHIRQEMQK